MSLPTPAGRLAGHQAYAPKKPKHAIRLKLDANESTESDALLSSCTAALTASTVCRYPKPAALEAQLAARFGLAPDQLLVTAGADDALARCCQAYLEPGRRALVTAPSFEMIPRYIQLAGAEVLEQPWFNRPFPTEALVAQLQTERPAVVFVCSPSSPAGEVLSPEAVTAIAAAAEATGALFVLDQAYGEFADVDLTPTALRCPNTVITRTLSKAWGLAGLRVGYALGPAALIAPLRVVGQPYAVSHLSLAAAGHALTHLEADMQARVAAVREERAALAAWLTAHDLAPLPSQGNFLLVPHPGDSWPWVEALAAQGVGVRWFDHGVAAGAIRFTLPGQAAAFDALMRALEATVPS